jgi:acetyl esterase/lipase
MTSSASRLSATPLLLALAVGATACGGGDDAVSTSTGGAGGAGGGGGAPAVAIGVGPEAATLADAPARCGQAAHRWLRDGVGEVRAFETKVTYTKGLLETLTSAAGVTLPRPLTYDTAIHVVTYATQDRGKLLDATAAVAWPTNVEESASPLPVLLLLHGTSGFTDGCGPTHDSATFALAAALASTGFVVVAPDYIGMKYAPPPTGFLHPYLVGQATAIASLDAVRAALRLPADAREGGARASSRVVVVGGSQGGHAALWVDRLARYYASELEIAGVAATVPPADMLGEGTLALTSLRQSSGNIAAFFGASAGWYGASARLDEVFVPPYDAEVPKALGASCDPGAVVKDIQGLEQFYPAKLLAAAKAHTLGDVAPWGCMLAENGLTTTSIARLGADAASYGILFVTGAEDQLVDTPTERTSFATLCEAGMPLRYLECKGASHTKTTVWALPEILEFLEARLAGEPFAPSCEVGAATVCKGTK